MRVVCMLKLINDGVNRYRLKRSGKMAVEGIVYANEYLLPLIKAGKSLQQLANAAGLPGVAGPVCGMPDMHEGFGLPIGGVMACAADGVISAGAVGMDINCGVRLLATGIPAEELGPPFLRRLMERIEAYVPTGTGRRGRNRDITRGIFEEAVHIGPIGLVDRGYGLPGDLAKIEEGGCLPGADLGAVSGEARRRGAVQLGTLGGGNHFIELQVVSEVYDRAAADIFGLSRGALTVMLHTGSRGFGHQICSDYSKTLLAAAARHGIEIPDRGLACAPADSPEGKDYYAAMACAVNYAFANRQLITHEVRRAFKDVLGAGSSAPQMDLIYDVAHNIAKWEKHDGKRLLVHRKGATRALPPGHAGNPAVYRHTGHPVLIPGSMGTASYVLTGTEKAAQSYFSVNHGAGRVLSRKAAMKEITKEQFVCSMSGVLHNSGNYKELLDEAPGAYKDIDQVVETLAVIGMTRKVARLKPLAVIKGKD